MKNVLCARCKTDITEGNSHHGVLDRGKGYCKSCISIIQKERYNKNPEKYRDLSLRFYKEYKDEILRNRREDPRLKKAAAARQRKYLANNREEINQRHREWRLNNLERCLSVDRKHARTLKGRHTYLRKRLKEEGTPKSDIIWNYNFYVQIIFDKTCHYCQGTINPTGHCLDRIDNSLGHLGSNVVPCCKSCNQKKSNDTSYEEMMLLAPVLREIRSRRESRIGEPSGSYNSECIKSVE